MVKVTFRTSPANLCNGIEIGMPEAPKVGDYVDMGAVVSFEAESSEAHEKAKHLGKQMVGVVTKRIWYRGSKTDMRMIIDVELCDEETTQKGTAGNYFAS